ncbi:uncharacterized protein DDB_G0283697-like [Aphidius gifuensis]|uniref:uncharacterized protein DDB_G0283697-like n=1 Tax=Aphidius gifuensis TaxID=684658 RepID=UPI001CDB9B34|nr:uncharacterized protein DDB_G0283697-like [Aphidius gifuensis]
MMEQSEEAFQLKMENATKNKKFDSWESIVKVFQDNNEIQKFAHRSSVTVTYRNKHLKKANKRLLHKKLKYYSINRYCKLKGESKSGIHRKRDDDDDEDDPDATADEDDDDTDDQGQSNNKKTSKTKEPAPKKFKKMKKELQQKRKRDDEDDEDDADATAGEDDDDTDDQGHSSNKKTSKTEEPASKKFKKMKDEIQQKRKRDDDDDKDDADATAGEDDDDTDDQGQSSNKKTSKTKEPAPKNWCSNNNINYINKTPTSTTQAIITAGITTTTTTVSTTITAGDYFTDALEIRKLSESTKASVDNGSKVTETLQSIVLPSSTPLTITSTKKLYQHSDESTANDNENDDKIKDYVETWSDNSSETSFHFSVDTDNEDEIKKTYGDQMLDDEKAGSDVKEKKNQIPSYSNNGTTTTTVAATTSTTQAITTASVTTATTTVSTTKTGIITDKDAVDITMTKEVGVIIEQSKQNQDALEIRKLSESTKASVDNGSKVTETLQSIVLPSSTPLTITSTNKLYQHSDESTANDKEKEDKVNDYVETWSNNPAGSDVQEKKNQIQSYIRCTNNSTSTTTGTATTSTKTPTLTTQAITTACVTTATATTTTTTTTVSTTKTGIIADKDAVDITMTKEVGVIMEQSKQNQDTNENNNSSLDNTSVNTTRQQHQQQQDCQKENVSTVIGTIQSVVLPLSSSLTIITSANNLDQQNDDKKIIADSPQTSSAATATTTQLAKHEKDNVSIMNDKEKINENKIKDGGKTCGDGDSINKLQKKQEHFIEDKDENKVKEIKTINIISFNAENLKVKNLADVRNLMIKLKADIYVVQESKLSHAMLSSSLHIPLYEIQSENLGTTTIPCTMAIFTLQKGLLLQGPDNNKNFSLIEFDNFFLINVKSNIKKPKTIVNYAEKLEEEKPVIICGRLDMKRTKSQLFNVFAKEKSKLYVSKNMKKNIKKTEVITLRDDHVEKLYSLTLTPKI